MAKYEIYKKNQNGSISKLGIVAEDSNKLGGIGASSYALKTDVPTSSVTVDSSLDNSSTNPVQNKIVTNNINRIDTDINTLFDDVVDRVPNTDVSVNADANKIVKRDSGGHINVKYVNATWLKTTEASESPNATQYAVLNSGWIYYKTEAQMKASLGIKTITLTDNGDGTVDLSIT